MSTCMEIENLRRLKVVLSALAFMGLFVFSIDDSRAQESYEFQRLGYRTYLDEDCDASKSPVSQLNPEAHFQRVGYVNGESRRHATRMAIENTAAVRIRTIDKIDSNDDKSGLARGASNLNAQILLCENGRQVLLTNLHGIRAERKLSDGRVEEFTQSSLDIQDPSNPRRRLNVSVPWDLMLKEGFTGYKKGWRDDYQDGVFNTDSDWAVIPLAKSVPSIKGTRVCLTSKDEFEQNILNRSLQVFTAGYHFDPAAPRGKLLVDTDVIPVVDHTRPGINRRSFQFGYDSFPGSSGQGVYAARRNERGEREICLAGINSWMGTEDPIVDPASPENVANGHFATARLITNDSETDLYPAFQKACEMPARDLPPMILVESL